MKSLKEFLNDEKSFIKLPKLFDITIEFDFLLFIIGMIIMYFYNVLGAFIVGVACGYDMKYQLKRLREAIYE